jgi:hypothetical protein
MLRWDLMVAISMQENFTKKLHLAFSLKNMAYYPIQNKSYRYPKYPHDTYLCHPMRIFTDN